jgi:hypothetical protein
VISQASDKFDPVLPILDCVADMQVVFVSDNDGDGEANDINQDLILTAEAVRKVREVRVYILAQEGQRDRSYTYPNQTVRVGETIATGGIGNVGRDFDLDANVTDWQRYRWKLYTMVVRPVNLR